MGSEGLGRVDWVGWGCFWKRGGVDGWFPDDGLERVHGIWCSMG